MPIRWPWKNQPDPSPAVRRETRTEPDGTRVETIEMRLGAELLHAIHPARLVRFEDGGPPVWSVGCLRIEGERPYWMFVSPSRTSAREDSSDRLATRRRRGRPAEPATARGNRADRRFDAADLRSGRRNGARPRPAPRVVEAVASDDLARFFAPQSATDLALTREGEALTLHSPLVHPGALRLLAREVGVGADALVALADGRIWLADDGALRLWPWYPEEDAQELPRARAEAARLGVALPGRCLDEPFDPSYYLRRTGPPALDRVLGARGLAVPRIEQVPIPPRARPVRYEGGERAPTEVDQAAGTLERAVDLFRYVSDEAQRAEVQRRIEGAFARLCGAYGGAPAPAAPRDETALEVPEAGELGRVTGLCAVADGVVLSAGSLCLHVDREGTLRDVFPGWLRFAAGAAAEVQGPAIRDLAARAWCVGTVAEHLHRFGALEALPSTWGHDERTTPVISACGRYLYDVDETPYVVRLADDVVVADHFEWPEGPGSGRALLHPEDLAVGAVTVLDGVRFTVRSGAPPVEAGRSLALALAGKRWRRIVDDRVLEGGRTIARLGVPAHGSALDADGRTAWFLTDDHLVRVDLDPAGREPAGRPDPAGREPAGRPDPAGREPPGRPDPRVGLVAPLASILAEAR